jgi:hypothetical protein
LKLDSGLITISEPFSPNYRDFSGYNEAASWSEKPAVQCLYCDTKLKTFRGFFDEDFCCREHREKYSSSFRKALTGFGDLQKPGENFLTQTTAPQQPTASEPQPDPRTADFQPIRVLPLINDARRDGPQPELLTVSPEFEIPNSAMAWSAVLEFEERPADLTAPSGGTFGILQAAPPHTPAMFDEPISPAPAQLSITPFGVSAGTLALAPTSADEYAELPLFCEEVRSAPVPCSEIAPGPETQIPAFSPASDMLQGDDKQATDATEPYWGELYSDPEPRGLDFGSSLAVAPEMAWSSAPVDRPVLAQGNLPVLMAPSLELASARSAKVPALSPAAELQPQLAPERATDFVDGEAVDSAAAPRSHEPLKLTFGNLVKIKNWRLRITFAKPA